MHIKTQLTRRDFKQMATIEALYYEEKYITDWQDSYDWFVYSKDTIVAVEEQDNIVGFMNLFPISDQLYEQIHGAGYHEGYLDLNDVLRVRDGVQDAYHLFLSCVVVHPNHRKSNALNIILAEYASRYEAYRLRGTGFKMVITHNVTEDGLKFSNRLGFTQVTKTNDGTHICKINYDDFIQHVYSRLDQMVAK